MTGPNSIAGRVAAELGNLTAIAREKGLKALAEHLAADGQVGVRSECERCILARHLLREIPELGYVRIEPSPRGSVCAGGVYLTEDADERDIALSPELNLFAQQFDSAVYVDLIDLTEETDEWLAERGLTRPSVTA